MDYQVIIGQLAQRDLIEIHTFIAGHDPLVAQAFINRLIEEVKSLKTFPQRGGHLEEKPGVRFIVLRPYLIVYRVVETRQEVRILRFWHSARERSHL